MPLLAVLFEWLLRDTRGHAHGWARCSAGPSAWALAKGIGAALFWADPGDQRVAFLHSFVLLLLPYLGLVVGGRKGEWLEPARLMSLFRAARARAALQDSRHLA